MIEDEVAAEAWVRARPECDERAADRLARLVVLLRAENTRQNLVSRDSMLHVWQRHIADSAQLLKYVPRETSSCWLDLGTGAGFPGLIVAVLRPDIAITLVESRKRRVEWLGDVCRDLALNNCAVAGMRLEDVETQQVDYISARAFAPLNVLLNLSARFSTSRTMWLLPKGRSAAQELSVLSGWHHTFHVEQSLTDPEAGIVVGNLAGQKGS